MFPQTPPTAFEHVRFFRGAGVVASLDREMIAMTPTYDVMRPDGGPVKKKRVEWTMGHGKRSSLSGQIVEFCGYSNHINHKPAIKLMVIYTYYIILYMFIPPIKMVMGMGDGL